SLAASATEYAKPAAPARWHNCAHDELAGRHAHNARSGPAVRRPCGADRDGHMIVSNRTVLVAGASGLVGFAAAEHFAVLPGWRVLALSRRRPELPATVRHLPVDLTDAAACRQALGQLTSVTHVVFAALYEKPDLVAGWLDPEQMAVNLAMLRN